MAASSASADDAPMLTTGTLSAARPPSGPYAPSPSESYSSSEPLSSSGAVSSLPARLRDSKAASRA